MPSNTTPPAALKMAEPVHHLEALAREPMVVDHPGGDLFVAGYGEPTPVLFRNRDRGATWARVNVGTTADGALGNSDVDLAVAPDGTIYFVSMVFDRKAGEGVSISIGVSRDLGGTWKWTLLSKSRFDDRPWVEVAPDGTAHVIWNDGEGVCHAVSRDGGTTWEERARVHDEGGSSHLAIGPRNEIAVRISPVSASGLKIHQGVDLIAVSSDGGATWAKHAAPGQREWMFPMSDDDLEPRWVEPLAWDADGALYSLWTKRHALLLARSTDRGASWQEWRVLERPDLMYFPYLIARGSGELAATWFSAVLPDSSALKLHTARIDVGGGDAPPRVRLAPPIEPDSWVFTPPPNRTGRQRDPAGEYAPVVFLRDGGLAVVSTIQDPQQKRFGFSWWRVRE